MTNSEKVLKFIESEHPRRVTNHDIAGETGIKPHQQVFQLTQKLLNKGQIKGIKTGNEWYFWANTASGHKDKTISISQDVNPSLLTSTQQTKVTAAQFEVLAADAMGRHLGVPLSKGNVVGINKTFDLVSSDQTIVGDAKYYTMVQGDRIPPAKFSVIAEYVWLLEHANATYKFLVFGNDRRVPEQWLKRYGSIVSDVKFFFLADDGHLQEWDTH